MNRTRCAMESIGASYDSRMTTTEATVVSARVSTRSYECCSAVASGSVASRVASLFRFEDTEVVSSGEYSEFQRVFVCYLARERESEGERERNGETKG